MRHDGDLTRVEQREDKEVDGCKGYTGSELTRSGDELDLKREVSGFPTGMKDSGTIY